METHDNRFDESQHDTYHQGDTKNQFLLEGRIEGGADHPAFSFGVPSMSGASCNTGKKGAEQQADMDYPNPMVGVQCTAAETHDVFSLDLPAEDF